MNAYYTSRARIRRTAHTALITIVAAGALRAQVPPDSVDVAQRAGVQAAQQKGVGAWFAAGALVPPVLLFGSGAALANQHNHPYAVPAAIVFDAGVIIGLYRLMHRRSIPSDLVVTHAIGPATEAQRAAFTGSYRSTLHERMAFQYRWGMLLGGAALGLFSAAVIHGLAGAGT